MNIGKYSKAIASALGTLIATGYVMYQGGDPESITVASVGLAGAFNTLLVFFSPKNAE